MLGIERNPLRFRYRLVGTKLSQVIGSDRTGKYMDEIVPGFEGSGASAALQTIADKGIPLWRKGYPALPYEERMVKLEVVHLPMAADNDLTDMILSLTVYFWHDGTEI